MLILVVISATVLYKRFLKPCFSIQSEAIPETVPERIIEKEPQNVIYVINPKFCRDVSEDDFEEEDVPEIQKENEKIEIVQKNGIEASKDEVSKDEIEDRIEDRIVEKVLKRLGRSETEKTQITREEN